MNIENLKHDIQNNYNNVLRDLKNWDEQSFLNSLVTLETNFAYYILQALNTDRYTKHIKWWENSKYIDNERLEHAISKRILWKKVSITNLLNQWIKKFNQNEQNSGSSTNYKETSENQKNPLDQLPLDINDNPPNINYEVINKPEIQEIINTVQSHRNRNTDYAIRYVVVMISRLVKRDVNFFFSPEEEKVKQLQLKTYNDYPNVICKTLSELIRDVLYLLWINSKVIISTNTKVPLYALIVEGEKCMYFIDALIDLHCSQYRIQPRCYGSYITSKNNILHKYKLPLIELSPDFIREIDTDTWLIESNYFSDTINSIRDTFTIYSKAESFFKTKDHHLLFIKKFEYISENYINLFSLEWPIERACLYSYFKSFLFNRAEKTNTDKNTTINRHNEIWTQPSFFIWNRINKENNPVFIEIQYGSNRLVFEELKEGKKYKIQPVPNTNTL